MKAKYEANNLAYTSNFLPLHTDLPYYDYISGVSVLSFFRKVWSLGNPLIISVLTTGTLILVQIASSFINGKKCDVVSLWVVARIGCEISLRIGKCSLI